MKTAACAELSKGIFLDIESTLSGDIFEIGYVFEGESAVARTSRERAQLLRRLNDLADRMPFVAGHNILWHDLPVLNSTGQCPELLKRPVLDTLLLSPIAFPQKPYHRLIKNDKLVSTSKSNPLNDALASHAIARDIIRTLLTGPRDDWPIIAGFLNSGNLPKTAKDGIALLSKWIGRPGPSPEEALSKFATRYSGQFCASGLSRLLQKTDINPWLPLAFFAAWIRVAGTDSIVPPWVKRQFPDVYTVIEQLRSIPCGDSSCTYCAETHNPRRQLQKYFNYEAFRPEPSLPDSPDRSLQEEIVCQAMAGRPLLAILPTGGGKSICFQIPALQRYYRDGALTVVISPLQALMKDQVDGLATKTGVRCVGALHGLLTPPERGELLEELQLGGIGIIYVSPEQLRNPSFRNAIALRDIAYWVCDEAHCISKWGHDFRPDYLYISRFIRDLSQASAQRKIAPILCLTATAKEDVKEEIRQHFSDQLGQTLLLLDGGAERTNLAYRVEPVESTNKAVRIHEILMERLEPESGAAVVFVSTQRHAEHTAELLKGLKWSAEFFHAGLDPEAKKDVLDRFIVGSIRVICATNAFGMGIDKEDIRLVIHADVPGSLENYLQEAGRAGRDRKPAECILLFNEQDLERQFSMGAFSRIFESDIRKILSALRNAERRSGREDGVCVSTREILLGCKGGTSMEDDPDSLIDTKVKTAISVLEEGQFLARNDNLTRVFQGRPLVQNMEEAETLIAHANLPLKTAELWRQFMSVFIALPEYAPNSVEHFAEVPAMARVYEIEKEKHGRFWNRYQPIFDTLNDMADAGLIKKDLLISAIVHVDSVGSSDLRRKKWIELEKHLLALLREKDPDPERPVPLNLKKVNTALCRELNEATLIGKIPIVMELWRRDRPRMNNEGAAFIFKKYGSGYIVEIPTGWDSIAESAELRQNAGALILEYILERAREKYGRGRHEIEFAESDLIKVLKNDIIMSAANSKSLARIIRFVLVSLHDQEVLVLKNGKALFTQSMQIQLKKDKEGKFSKRFSKAHFDRLEIYYAEKTFQIHVMAEYAKLGMEALTAHMKLIRDYFQLGNAEFAKRYFAGRQKELELATGMESYLQIVESLGNKNQQAIVAAPELQNMLILAGPGSGKTRVVSHRCAYLLRVRRVRPRSILVVCFNRHACLTLRQRIGLLVGEDARRVTIQTYHGLALSLLGKTFSEEGPRTPPESINFDALISDATELLKAPAEDAFDADDTLRSRLLRGYQHILVDEYQDISQREYDFLSQIAGRTIKDSDQKLSILAVGDDDQSIYKFRDANVRFIQQFKEDYNAETHLLTDNYRSTVNIIQAANQLIRLNVDRMKTGHEIHINERRQHDPTGGDYENLDRLRKGRVQIIEHKNALYEAAFAIEEIETIRHINPDATWDQFAIISRNKADLNPVRALLEAKGIPVDYRADTDALHSPFRIREIHTWLLQLNAADQQIWDADRLAERLAEHSDLHAGSPWCELLYEAAEEWKTLIGKSKFPVRFMRDFFVEALHEFKLERRNAKGIVLANAHRIKGLQFPHVFLLSPNWKSIGHIQDVEEERRLYYVAMTRAEQTLTLFQTDHIRKWLEPLQGTHILRRQWTPNTAQQMRMEAVANFRYENIGLDQLFISYAGMRSPETRIHKTLKSLKTGSLLSLVRDDKGLLVRAENGVDVASLSTKGRALWEPRLSQIINVRTKALLTRYADDAETRLSLPSRTESWEIPIVEVAWRQVDTPSLMVAEDPPR